MKIAGILLSTFIFKMKLATVEKIVSLQPIEGADKVELATVLGWDVVVKKDQFVPGDYCIYIPIDTVVDLTKPWFGFLKSNRIKTSRIRGTWSQGLVLPISDVNIEVPLEEDTDVSELLGVTKYEKEVPAYKAKIKNFVQFPADIIAITDEDNLRTKNQALAELFGKQMYISKKMDGSSMTTIWSRGKFVLCSRRIVLLSLDTDGTVKLEEQSPMIDFARKHQWTTKFTDRNIAVQGEFCGPKVNGNKMKLTSFKYFVFNVKDLDTGRFFSMAELQDFCITNGFEMVPILKVVTCEEADWNIAKFQEEANSVKYCEEQEEGEGIVIRPVEPFFSRVLGKSFSVKVINQKYKD